MISPTADLASKAGGQRRIIEKHKYDETPPLRPRTCSR